MVAQWKEAWFLHVPASKVVYAKFSGKEEDFVDQAYDMPVMQFQPTGTTENALLALFNIVAKGDIEGKEPDYFLMQIEAWRKEYDPHLSFWSGGTIAETLLWKWHKVDKLMVREVMGGVEVWAKHSMPDATNRESPFVSAITYHGDYFVEWDSDSFDGLDAEGNATATEGKSVPYNDSQGTLNIDRLRYEDYRAIIDPESGFSMVGNLESSKPVPSIGDVEEGGEFSQEPRTTSARLVKITEVLNRHDLANIVQKAVATEIKAQILNADQLADLITGTLKHYFENVGEPVPEVRAEGEPAAVPTPVPVPEVADAAELKVEYTDTLINALRPVGKWITLRDLPYGRLFVTEDQIIGVKSEYTYAYGSQAQCILLASGEYGYFSKGNATLVKELRGR